MKKIILVLTIGLLSISCSSSSDDSSSSSGNLKWKFKMDGVQYEWSGDFPYSATSGQSSYLGEPASTPTISLVSPIISSGNRQVMLTFTFPNESTGTSIIDDSVIGNSASLVINSEDIYSTSSDFGGVISLNITQMASSTNGITKGTFSGTMVKLDQELQTVEITEGSFEAIRIQ